MFNPLAASSCARIEPVQPSPTITTSVAGSLRAISGPPLPSSIRFMNPFWTAADANRWQRIALVMPINPVAVVVARAGISDHLPGNHVTVTTVYWVSEKSLARVLQQLLEECPADRAFQLYFALLQPREHVVLFIIGNFGEGLSCVGSTAILVERGQPLAIPLRRRQWRLVALLWCSVGEGPTHV